MSNEDQQISKTNLKIPLHETEEWKSDARETAAHIAHEEPELTIAFAAFVETFPYVSRKNKDGQFVDPSDDEKAYLYLLLQAALVEQSQRVSEWKQLVEEYPKEQLTEKQAKRGSSPQVQTRAHYLASALTSLLKITNAPPSMIADLQAILGLHKPRAAEIRAAAQKALIENPKVSARKIARGLARNPKTPDKDRDHTQISTDLKKGLLARPKRPVNSRTHDGNAAPEGYSRRRSD